MREATINDVAGMNITQLALLDQARNALHESLNVALVVQTRLKPYFDDMSGRVAAQQPGTHRPTPCGCSLTLDANGNFNFDFAVINARYRGAANDEIFEVRRIV
ncbi:MAG: hypothetical protein PXX77_03460 [Gallionella sp.]|nr:hypothetical protein [Gallionella sp.]